MELINDRYRVIKNISQNQMVSSYVVADLKRNNKQVQLNILNPELMPSKLLDFYANEFLILSGINSSRVLRLYNFGVINSFDGKGLENNQYYFVREKIEDTINLVECIKDMNDSDVIDIFIQVCQGINCLHLKGFIYKDLNIDNIYLTKDEEGYKVKLKDIATVELEKHMHWHSGKGQLQFVAPEVLNGTEPDIYSDIYSLGVLLFYLCKRSFSQDVNLKHMIKDYKKYITSQNTKCMCGNIINIIEKIINNQTNERYDFVYEIIDDMNKILNRQYKAHIKEEMENIISKTRLIGREKEVDMILDAYKGMEDIRSFGGTYIVLGEHGIGKTRLLKEIKHRLILKNADVYSVFMENNSSANNEGIMVRLIRQVIPKADAEVMDRYMEYLAAFIPEMEFDEKGFRLMSLDNEREKLYLFSRILGFIDGCIKSRPAVFVIDNLHEADDLSIEFLKYIIGNLNKKPVMFIMSGGTKKDMKFNDFLDTCKNSNSFNEICLGSLTIEQTAGVIKDMLNLPNTPLNLSARIYTETYGNPLFIEEVIKNLYAQRIIYLNDKNGRWSIDIEDYGKIPIPSSIYQAVANQLESLDDKSKDILKVVSIFSLSVSSLAISKILKIQQDEVEEKLEFMLKKGFLDRKVEDWGYAYDLHNKGTKNFIYSSLKEEEKREKHRLASDFLEEQYRREGRENKEELIYHLEKAGEKEKVIEYCLETADKMESIQIKSEALKNLQKALSMFEEDSKEIKKIDILIRIGRLHRDEGRNSEALNCFEKVLNLIGPPYTERQCIDALNQIVNIYLIMNEMDKCAEYFKLIDSVLEKIDYEEGYLRAQMEKARFFYHIQEYKKVVEVCKGGLELCHDKYLDIEASFCNQLAIINMEETKVEQALEGFQKTVSLLEETNNVKHMPAALNNIGVIYGDYLQDVEKSLEYFLKMKEICERYNIIGSHIMADMNIAECYTDMDNNNMALEHYKSSLELSKMAGYESTIFTNYANLSRIYIRTFKYKEAWEYFELLEEEFGNYPVQRKSNISEYYKTGTLIYYTFGLYSTAEEYAIKALEANGNDDYRGTWDCEVMIEYIRMKLYKDKEEIRKSLLRLRDISRKYKLYMERVNILYNLIFISLKTENSDLFEELKIEADEISKRVSSEKITAKKLYVDGIAANESDKLRLFESALEIAKNEKMKTLEWNIYNSIGDYYFEKGKYYDSTRYYFEACEVIKSITLQIPENMRINYINNHGLLIPFEKLLEIKGIYKDEELKKATEHNTIIINTLEDLNDLFKYKGFWKILDNDHFIKAAEKSFDNTLPSGIHEVGDLIRNLSKDPTKNLDTVIKLMGKMLLATRGFIILENDDEASFAVASLKANEELPNIEYVIEKVNSLGKPILISESNQDELRDDSKLLPNGVKTAVCIPVLKSDNIECSCNNKTAFFRNKIWGYIYLDSDRILNNFNERNFEECHKLSGFVGMLLENYRLKIISSIDKLTGAYTRKYLVDILTEEFEKCSVERETFSIIMFDIDKFKNVNDKFGHQKGDYVLKEICRVVKKNIPEKYKLCRYGGEEFIIILPGTDYKKAGAVAESIRLKVENAKILGDMYPITISLGVAAYPVHAQIEQELIEKVDQALYVAKESGRNRCQIWNPEIANKTKRKDRLAGIVSGNALQDYRNVLAMIELIELVKDNISIEDKIYKLLGRAIEITEAQYGILFLVEDDKVVKKYGRRKFHEGWLETKRYNRKILENVVKDKQGIYRVDWDDITEYDSLTGSPDWQSIIAVPIIKSSKTRGVLYLTVSTKIKEFDFNQFNFVNTLGDITAAIL